MRKVFLEDLPRWEEGKCKGKINWKKSIGYDVKFIYNDIEGWIKIIDYNIKATKVKIKYNDNDFDIANYMLVKCNLGRILGIKTLNFKVEVGTRFQDEKRYITIIDRKYQIEYYDKQKYTKKYYKYHCNKDGYEGWIEESNLNYHKKGCSVCANQIIIKGINDIPTTASWMVKYFQGGYDEAKLYSHGSSKKFIPMCPDCGRVRNKPLFVNSVYRTHSIGCSCGDGYSFPNKLAFNLLEELDIGFINEYSPEWCKYLFKEKHRQGSYDFYFKLNNKEYILEMDGGFHFTDNKMNSRSHKESKFIDDEKDKLAKEHGIEVIRIDCFLSQLDYIKENILKSNLNKLFDLSKITWLKIEEKCLINKVKEACNYWDNGIHSTKEIGETMNINITTIRSYLRKGKERGWCNYDGKNNMSNNCKKIAGVNKKAILCIIEKQNLTYIFESGSRLERQSEEIFGTKLFVSHISKVCNNKKTFYKGFTFKYIEDLTQEEYIKYDIENKLKELHNQELVQAV